MPGGLLCCMGARRSCWWLCCVPVWTVGGVSGVCLGMDSAGAVWVCAWMHQLPAWAERLRSGNGPQLVIMLPSTLNSTRRRFRGLLGGIHPQKCFDDPVAVLSTKIILARQLQEGGVPVEKGQKALGFLLTKSFNLLII